MRRAFVVSLVLLVLVIAPNAFATNGTNLIGVGPISRSMGGTGIAAPQDAISATFANPAGMCFGPYCPGSEVNFAGTLFMPQIDASEQGAAFVPFGGGSDDESDFKVYAIPAFGISVPITNAPPMLRFGLAAYGVSGLGVDYRNTTLPAPVTTQLQIMKFSPNIAYQPNDKLSLGLGVHIDYSALDLQDGVSFNYGIGVQIGAIYKVMDALSVGLTYVSPQEVNHENVIDYPDANGFGDGIFEDLKLESPQQLGFGVAFQPMGDKLLLALDYKWLNWSSAAGYEDFDWKDQHVIALGAQFKPIPKLALRVGYNYAENPVKVHDINVTPGAETTIQGNTVGAFALELFRIIGFPAIVEQHVTVGFGYAFSNRFSVDIGYMHAFENDITETAAAAFGGASTALLKSTLKEDSVEFGLTWRY